MKRWLLVLFIICISLISAFPKNVLSATAATIVTTEQTVYVTKTGTKFHRGSCHHLKKSKIKTTRTKAMRSGYSACKVCKP